MKESINNVPIPSRKSVPIEHLVPPYAHRKYIKSERVKELAEKKFYENGTGITIQDIISECGLSKRKAQRKVKHLLRHRILFTAQDLKKIGIIIPGVKRERPQRYYPFTKRTGSKERINKKNIPNDTLMTLTPTSPYNLQP